MPKDKKIPLCKSCDKPLQIETCRECDGRGSIGYSFWKHTCESCNGSGEEFRCRNEAEHIMEARRKMFKPTFKHSSQFKDRPFKGLFNPCPRCGGSGTVFNPVTKMRVPCPSCRKFQKPPPYKPPYGGAPPPGHSYWQGRR